MSLQSTVRVNPNLPIFILERDVQAKTIAFRQEGLNSAYVISIERFNRLTSDLGLIIIDQTWASYRDQFREKIRQTCAELKQTYIKLKEKLACDIEGLAPALVENQQLFDSLQFLLSPYSDGCSLRKARQLIQGQVKHKQSCLNRTCQV